MKFRMQESLFGAPVGVYKAKFLGISPMKNDKPRVGRDGKEMGPSVEWRFQVVEGKSKDQIISRITGEIPTPGNICGILINGMTGRRVVKGAEVDIDPYVGRLFLVTVGPHKEKADKTYVTAVSPLAAEDAATAPEEPEPQQAQPARRGPTPPGRRNQAPKDVPDLEATYWVDAGDQEPKQMTGLEIADAIKDGKLTEDVDVCDLQEKVGYKSARDWGFHIPF